MAFDWKNPDYKPIWLKRAERLSRLRADAGLLAEVRYYYREHPGDMINDWGVTLDPRVTALNRRALMPFLLWPKQREWIEWLYDRWKLSEPGTTVKSRDQGASWLAMGFCVVMCTNWKDFHAGVGSEKEDKVDRSGDPDCLFYKGRLLLTYWPPEFRAGFSLKQTSAHMRLIFPDTNSSTTGEAGNNIGRGGRKSIYLVDESAHVPNPKALDASLSATTDCRIDLSSVWGTANSFYERAHMVSIPRFDFDWRDDPRKDAAWEIKKRAEVSPVIFAAEYDRNFSASIEGIVIPPIWVSAAVDAHKLLGVEPTGVRFAAMDIADGGSDKNALAIGRSFLIEHVESWKGSEDRDIYHSVEHAFTLCDMHGVPAFDYDADGLGASARGDSRKINEARRENKGTPLRVNGWRASGEVFNPEVLVPGTERTALDFFENAKAQAWWLLMLRFQYTFRAVEAFKAGEKWDIDPSKFISISSTFPECARLRVELSQPIWMQSKHGKVMVDKCPVGTKTEVRNSLASPNLADSVMMLYAPRFGVININPALLAATAINQSSRLGARR